MFQAEGATRRNKRTGEVQTFVGGQWVAAGVSPGPVAEPQPLISIPDAPYKASADRRADEDLQLRREAAARAAAAAERAAEAANKPPKSQPLSQKQIGELRAREQEIGGFARQLGNVEQLYQELYAGDKGGVLGIGGSINLTGHLPNTLSPANRRFSSAAQSLIGPIAAAQGATGGEMNSLAELQARFGPMLPQSDDDDATIEQKLRMLREMEQTQRSALAAQLGIPAPPVQPPAQQDDRSNFAAVPAGPGGVDRTQQTYASPSGGKTVLSQGSQWENDPALAGVNARYREMLAGVKPKGGVSEEQIEKYLRSVGITDPGVFQSMRQQVRTRRQYPNIPVKEYDTGTIDDRQVPLSDARSMLNTAAQTPGGSYAINAADALTMGTLDNMTDNPALARAGMDALRQQNPVGSMLGTVTGGLLAAGGIEAGLGRAGVGSGRAAIGSDLLYGAGYGAGSADEGNRALGAVTGAAAARAGGYVGSKVASGTGTVLTGARDAGTRYLAQQGVPLTLGQIAGQGGRVGRTIKGLEDKLESVPYLGDAIRQRRMEGFEAVNRAAFDEALAPIGSSTGGKIAETGVETAFDETTSAYRKALSGVTVNGADPVFMRQFAAAANKGQALPGSMREEFDYVMKEHVVPRFDTSGNLTGDAYQDIRRALREERRAWKSKPRGNDYGNALLEVERSLEGMVRRQAPDAIPLLNKADAAYRKVKVLQSAVANAKNNNSGGVFSPAQLGTAAEANARKYGGSATTDRPFFELQRSAQDILPSSVPNSGTADRAIAAALLPSALGGAGAAAGFIDPSTAAGIAALGIPYSRGGANIIQRLATSRPDAAINLGEAMIKRRRAGGLFAAGASPLLLPGY